MWVCGMGGVWACGGTFGWKTTTGRETFSDQTGPVHTDPCPLHTSVWDVRRGVVESLDPSDIRYVSVEWRLHFQCRSQSVHQSSPVSRVTPTTGRHRPGRHLSRTLAWCDSETRKHDDTTPHPA